jgi:hypothetical protein
MDCHAGQPVLLLCGDTLAVQDCVGLRQQASQQYEGGLKSSRANNEKTDYNFKIIFIFQHNLP